MLKWTIAMNDTITKLQQNMTRSEVICGMIYIYIMFDWAIHSLLYKTSKKISWSHLEQRIIRSHLKHKINWSHLEQRIIRSHLEQGSADPILSKESSDPTWNKDQLIPTWIKDHPFPQAWQDQLLHLKYNTSRSPLKMTKEYILSFKENYARNLFS